MKQTNHQASGKNSRAAQSKQARKSTGENTATSAAAPTPTWKPDRAWHARQRHNRLLLANLSRMTLPTVISGGGSDGMQILFARDGAGKELFFLEKPKYQHPGERALEILTRREAFALICLAATPACLRDYMMTVLKKGGAW